MLTHGCSLEVCVPAAGEGGGPGPVWRGAEGLLWEGSGQEKVACRRRVKGGAGDAGVCGGSSMEAVGRSRVKVQGHWWSASDC